MQEADVESVLSWSESPRGPGNDDATSRGGMHTNNFSTSAAILVCLSLCKVEEMQMCSTTVYTVLR